MSQEELKKYENRLYELKDLSILAINNKDYNSLTKYSKEIKKIYNILKKAEKESKKYENRWY